ncbi:MAG: extracellular solute-binding protein [Candidatus Ornithomonoglobus sp.]
MKKIIGILMAAALAVPVLSACNDKPEITNLSEDDAGNYVYDEEIELKIPVYDRDIKDEAPVNDNYWTKYIQANFGDKHNIKVIFVPISRNNDEEEFNRLIADKNEPDIIFSYDYPVAMEYYSEGAVQKIDEDMFKKYAPAYYNYTSENLEYGQVEGEQYFFAATRPDFDSYVTLIRSDWVKECGLEMPENDDDYYSMLKAFKANQCGGIGTIPMTYTLGNAYYSNYKFRDYPMEEKEKAMYSDISVASLTYEATRKQLEQDNKYFNEGLISPDWYLDTDGSQARKDFVSGKAGIYSCYLPDDSLFGELKENCPDAEIDVLPAYKEPYAERKYWSFGMLSGISEQCGHPEAVMMYLEWLCQEDNLFVLQNGVEGKTYKMKDGYPMLNSGYDGEERLINGTNKDLWCLVTERVDYGSKEANKNFERNTYVPDGYEYIIDEIYEKAEACASVRYEDTLFTRPVKSSAVYKEELEKKFKEYKIDLITCPPEQFEAKYSEYCKNYLEAGYQKVLDEKKKMFDSGEYMKE